MNSEKGENKHQIIGNKFSSVVGKHNHKFLKRKNTMKKNILVIGGIVALALLIVGAAFIGGRLLNGQGMGTSSDNGSGPSFNGPGGPISMDFKPAEELPERPADVVGMFDHRQDKSIFIEVGGRVTVQRDKDGNATGDSTGEMTEIVVTTQTTIYEDVTLRQYDGQPTEGQTIQQALEPGSLDDIGPAYRILVWGRESGGRFIAEILVYAAQ
jgi:hypothetical protein